MTPERLLQRWRQPVVPGKVACWSHPYERAVARLSPASRNNRIKTWLFPALLCCSSVLLFCFACPHIFCYTVFTSSNYVLARMKPNDPSLVALSWSDSGPPRHPFRLGISQSRQASRHKSVSSLVTRAGHPVLGAAQFNRSTPQQRRHLWSIRQVPPLAATTLLPATDRRPRL